MREYPEMCVRFAAMILLATAPAVVRAGVIYVDASMLNTDIVGGGADSLWLDGDDGSTGGTPADGSSNNDGLWRFRGGNGNNGVIEATGAGGDAEDAVEIVTTATGLANGTYNAYVFYFPGTGGTDHWLVRAGLASNPNANQIFDDGAEPAHVGAIAGFDASTLTFEAGLAPPVGGEVRTLQAGLVGQANVAGGSLSMYIDDYPATITGRSQDRTWYAGIGYELFVPPTIINSVQSGLATTASTWSDNLPPDAANNYHVLNTHTVTVDAAFPGKTLEVFTGGTIDISQDALHFPDLIVRPGGSLTESVSGDFALGDFNAAIPGSLTVEGNVSFGMDAGSDFFLDLEVFGPGDMDFNSNGVGSDLILTAAGSHGGTIRFNGSGDEVRVDQAEAFNILEMNSTGANRLFYDPTVLLQTGTVIFNQPGTIDHASTQTAGPQVRLAGPAVLEANAAVTIDLTKTFPINERRFFVNIELRGAGDIIVNGTSTDPTSGSITHNEFELGTSSEPSNPARVDPYSGTVTANDFVDLEMRHNLPNAKFVINSNARLEMGWQFDPNDPPIQSVNIGEVEVNSGGTLEVGYEQDGDHDTHQLRLTSSGSRSGDLTLATGSTTLLQVNGTAADEFDSIAAEGNVTLAGTLEVLVNPGVSGDADPTYAPTLGDMFDIISIVAPLLPTDFDGNGTVDSLDLAEWEAAYAVDDGADADGNGDSDGFDFLAWQRDFGTTGATVGAISGTFDSLTVTDSGNVMSGAGLAFQINYVSAVLVQLEVISAPPISAVPEPASGFLAAGAAVVLAFTRRRKAVGHE